MAPREADHELSAKDVSDDSGRFDLPLEWRFHPGDDPAWASPGFDDSAWEKVDTRLRRGAVAEGFAGLGWFRLRLRVEASLRGVPLGILLQQLGAAEVYLDGEPLYSLGTVAAAPEKAAAGLQQQPYLFAFDNREVHLLAVRFCNPERWSTEAADRGFVATLGEANRRVSVYGRNLQSLSAYQAFFTGVFAAFALLHLLLFAFYSEAAENLYFALLTSAVAILVYLFLESQLTTDPLFYAVYDRGMNTAWLALVLFALRFVYSIFEASLPRRFYVALAVFAALLIASWARPLDARPWIFVFLLLASIEMARTVVLAIVRRAAGARIVGLGILVLAAGIAAGLLANLGILSASIVTSFLVPFGSVLFLVLTISIYLSRKFAHTSRELRARLDQVEELSQQKLEQERRARVDEVERKLLEAKYERKVEELEEARKLQLSMLPERLPELPDLEVAAGMYTATEVGGDYYDFGLAADGTLTIAIGDATGHGMKAGTLVTATKSLFHAMDDATGLPQTLDRFGRALKRMNLRQLSMALLLARWKAGQLHLAGAGMPPALVYRAESGAVESVVTKGMPLGSFAGFPYQQRDLELDPGDTVLLMSDGFPERLNSQDEMLGYDKVSEAFSRVAATSPETIIERLVADGEAWAEGQPAVDDTTFVVLRMRAA